MRGSKRRRRLVGITVAWALASASVLAADGTEYQLQIESQSLGAALQEFSKQSGLQVVFLSRLTDGLDAPELKGKFTADSALRKLLAQSELTFEDLNENTIRIQSPATGEVRFVGGERIRLAQAEGDSPAPHESSEEVVVTGTHIRDGYVKKDVESIGPWDGRNLQDTPYAVSVIPDELIQNLQAVMPDRLFQVSPTTQFAWPQNQLDYPVVYLRGFLVERFARNGIRRDGYSTGTSTEDIASVETLTGLSGFLYGAGNVGGIVNFVSKRPTNERLNSLTVGNTTGSNVYAHGDFGGRIGSDRRFGYRINAVAQGGDTFVDHHDLQKGFVSVDFDWRVSDRLFLEIDASKRDWQLDGRQVYWYGFNETNPRPDAEVLTSKKLWGQKWANHQTESERYGASVRWQPLDFFTLRSGYMQTTDEEEFKLVFNALDSPTTYFQEIDHRAPRKYSSKAGYAYADLAFKTGAIGHKMTLGYMSSYYRRHDHPDAFTTMFSAGGLPLSGPVYADEPTGWVRPGTLPRQVVAGVDSSSWVLGDDVSFNDQWSVLAGVNYTTIHTPAVGTSRSYEESKPTPTVSIVYKPVPALTTYVSYMEALEAGGIAGDTFGAFPVVNAGEVQPPLVSDQYEVGAKLGVGKTLLTAAVFNIDRGLQYYDITDPTQPRYVQDGRQVHRGVELTITGKVSERLTVFGGTTLLDAKVKENKQTPGFEGKVPPGAAEKLIKLYAEYEVAGVPGLILNGGVTHTGDVYAEGLNTDKLPGYTLADVGVRYGLNITDHPVTLRLNVNNLTDKIYWANSFFVGDPRTISVSVNTRF